MLRLRTRLLALSALVTLVAVTPGFAPSAPVNPLLQPSTLPFGAPPFDRINAPTFENTLSPWRNRGSCFRE